MTTYVLTAEMDQDEDGRWSAWIDALPGCAALGPHPRGSASGTAGRRRCVHRGYGRRGQLELPKSICGGGDRCAFSQLVFERDDPRPMFIDRFGERIERGPRHGGFSKQPDEVRIHADAFPGSLPRESIMNRLRQSEQNAPTKPSRGRGLGHVITVREMVFDPKPFGFVQVCNGLVGSVTVGNAAGKINDLGCPITSVIRFMRQLRGVVQSQIVFQRRTSHYLPLSANDT